MPKTIAPHNALTSSLHEYPELTFMWLQLPRCFQCTVTGESHCSGHLMPPLVAQSTVPTLAASALPENYTPRPPDPGTLGGWPATCVLPGSPELGCSLVHVSSLMLSPAIPAPGPCPWTALLLSSSCGGIYARLSS